MNPLDEIKERLWAIPLPLSQSAKNLDNVMDAIKEIEKRIRDQREDIAIAFMARYGVGVDRIRQVIDNSELGKTTWWLEMIPENHGT
jgi:hypothetical protein